MATQVLVPPLGTNVDRVTLVRWLRCEGDAVSAGEPLFAVETDKATLDVEAPASGILRGVAAREGDEVAALSAIGWICGDGEEPPAPTEPDRPPAAFGAGSSPAQGASGTRAARGGPGDASGFASPWARTLAAERGLDWRRIAGTGPMGAVVARDIEAAAAGIVETFELTGIRGTIAARMLEGATQTAAVTLTAEVDATAFVALRQAVRDTGLPVSYNDLLLLVVARALARHPRMGATFVGGRAVVRKTIDIALAVDTDRGLMAPVVRDVLNLSLPRIAAETARLIEMARSGRATPEDLRGGLFTITNLGMAGIDAFTPIINPPETAILGVGRIRARPWVVDGCIQARETMWLSLTFDHRLVDGAPAARFLRTIVEDIEAPLGDGSG